ncbi:MAG: hypothetical protein EB060_06355 [Proteobacteria bacterium]|nr:hypothetical protein [Pseudomonadota bacterium]
MPWKTWLADAIEHTLETNGFQNVDISIAHVGIHGITFDKIAIGRPQPLVLEHLTIGYSLPELWHRHFETFTLRGVHLEAGKENDSWSANGFEGFSNTPTDTVSEPFTWPVSTAELTAIPFENLTIEESSLKLTTPDWKAELPFNLRWKKGPTPTLSYTSLASELHLGTVPTTIKRMAFDAKLNPEAKRWDGNWEMDGIQVKDAPLPVPTLQGNGILSATRDVVEVTGGFKSADTTYRSDLTLRYLFANPEKSALTIQAMLLPWNEGTLAVHNVRIPFTTTSDIKLDLEVRHVSVEALMQTLTKNRASATGRVSGTIPVIIKPDGSFLIHAGSLTADEPGTIAVSPDAIPGDNASVALVRDMLTNLHYKLLSIGMESGKDKKFSVTFAVEGNNPDVYEGRPVKLNVHFGGDVLELLEQSMISFTDPKKLIEQGKGKP